MESHFLFLSLISKLTLGERGRDVRHVLIFCLSSSMKLFTFVQNCVRNILYIIAQSTEIAWVVSAKMWLGTTFKIEK